MAVTVLFMDGFDDGAAVGMLADWATYAGGGTASAVTGRTGSALQLASGWSDRIHPISPGSQFVVSIAMKINTLFSAEFADRPPLFGLMGTNPISINPINGEMRLRNTAFQGGGTVYANPVFSTLNQWFHMEMYVETGTPGRVVVRIDETEIFDVNTINVSGITHVKIGTDGDAWQWDDLAVYNVDATGDRLGDVAVNTLFPDGNGTTNQGIGSDGNSTDNYLLVDENTVSTSDYVDISAAERELYSLQNLPFSNGTVHAVQPRGAMERTDSGGISAQSVLKIGVDETTISGTQPPYGSVGYVVYTPQATKPGGGAWTIADINNAEYGIEGV